MIAWFASASNEEAAVMLLIVLCLIAMAIMLIATYIGASKSARRKVGRLYSDPKRSRPDDYWKR